MKILLFAMDGLFSKVFLENLVLETDEITGMILPATSTITDKSTTTRTLDVLHPESIRALADSLCIPVFTIMKGDEKHYLTILEQTAPDMIIVACFPYKIPASVFNMPAKGAFNIHPSLLPSYRGPTPLFWQFYYGERNTGITIHVIDARFDCGDIVIQKTVQFNDGISTAEASERLALASASAFGILCDKIRRNKLIRLKQDNASASYFSWPGKSEFTLMSTWTARRAYNFICATRYWHQAYTIICRENQAIRIDDVTGFELEKRIDKDYVILDDKIIIQFSDGCLIGIKNR